MKILITAGGGGHFAPVVPVIQELPLSAQIVIVGRKYPLEGDSAVSFEHQVAKKLNIPFKSLTAGRLQRKFTRYTLFSLFKLPIGFIQGLMILLFFRPDVIVSFGGYISLPIVVWGAAVRIPIVIHEQTQQAGIANKIASYFARAVCVSWERGVKEFPKSKTVLTGNPVRKEIVDASHKTPIVLDMPLVYITGGSLGSHAINVLVEECLEKLLSQMYIVHQTGDARNYKDFERLKHRAESLDPHLKKRYTVKKFLDVVELSDTLQKAALVVSRAGINTITELLYLGKPALLIPIAVSQKNEQIKNAKLFASTGLGEIVYQDLLTGEKLFEKIISMLERIHTYRSHAEAAKKLVNIDAASKISHVILQQIS